MRSIAHVSLPGLKASVLVGLVAGTLLTGVVPASAQTVTRGAHHAQSVQPKGACNGNTGPFVKVLANYGTYYDVVSGPFVDENGTSNNSTSSFSNTWSGTISASVTGSLDVSENLEIESVKVALGITVTASATISGSHTVTYTVSPKTDLHAEYAELMADTYDESYIQNSVCVQSEVGEGDTKY